MEAQIDGAFGHPDVFPSLTDSRSASATSPALAMSALPCHIRPPPFPGHFPPPFSFNRKPYPRAHTA